MTRRELLRRLGPLAGGLAIAAPVAGILGPRQGILAAPHPVTPQPANPGRTRPPRGPGFDVKAFGARGNGITDDTRAIQAALDAARRAGGGTVSFSAGTYRVSLSPHPRASQYLSALVVGSRTVLIGAGRDASVIKLANGQPAAVQPGHACAMMNYEIAAGGDTGIVVQDLTVDGNAANQGAAFHDGIFWMRTSGVRHLRVRVKDMRGIARQPPFGETFHFETELGSDTTYQDCEALASFAGTASGFSANSHTNATWTNCWAIGMGIGQGFTHWSCQKMSYINCHAYRNAWSGFNSEASSGVTYLGCDSGGISSATTGGSFGFPPRSSLGNGQYGFIVNGTRQALHSACLSRNNGKDGMIFVGANGCQVVGGDYSNNAVGLALADRATTNIKFSGGVTATGNAVAPVGIPGYNLPIAGPLPAAALPPIPASGQSVISPFPMDCTVQVRSGLSSCRVVIGGIDIGVTLPPTTVGTFQVAAFQSIRLDYGALPAWSWSAI